MQYVGRGLESDDLSRLACSWPCLDHFVVAAGEGVPADDGDFLEHLDAVAQVAHAGALVVSPADRHLNDLKTALEGDQQDLWIETPAHDGLELKDGLSSRAGKGFETALGIGKVQAHDGARDGVEAAAKELAVERLAMGLAAAFEPARADGDVSTGGDGGKEALSFLDGRREISVGKDSHFAERLQHSGAHAVAFAAVAGVLDQPDLWRGLRKITRDLGGRIAGAIVDHDDLGIPATGADAIDHRLERRRQASGLIEGRNHDAVLRPGAVGHAAVAGFVRHVPVPHKSALFTPHRRRPVAGGPVLNGGGNPREDSGHDNPAG